MNISAYHERLNVLKYALERYEESPEKFSHLDPNQVDQNGDHLFHLVAKAKYNNMVLSATELLCKHNLSSTVYNNEGHLPSFYVKKQTDRRLQYIKLAAKVQFKPSLPKEKVRKDGDSSTQSPDIGFKENKETHEIREVIKISTQREIRKRKIEETIRVLPDSKISIFNIDHSPTKQISLDRISEKGDNSDEIQDKGGKQMTNSFMADYAGDHLSVKEDTKLKEPASIVNDTSMSGKDERNGKHGTHCLESGSDSSSEKGQSQIYGNELGEYEKTKMDVKVQDDLRQQLYDQVPASGNDQEDVTKNDIIDDVRHDEVIDDVIEEEDSETEEVDDDEEFVIDAQVNRYIAPDKALFATEKY